MPVVSQTGMTSASSGQQSTEIRVEHDALGDYEVPAEVFYGVATARARDNFNISGLRAPASLLRATVLVKKAAAEANMATGRLPPDIGRAIIAAADEVLGGAWMSEFVVDVFQAGAGTSHNMNVNEVLANIAAERLGGLRGTYDRVHPNDHVNCSQSTNDVYPTATRLALLERLERLCDATRALANAFRERAHAFSHVVKVGRTHLQDAVPMTFGQELGAYSANLEHAAAALTRGREVLLELNLGATAVGTGLNGGDDYRDRAIEVLVRETGWSLRPAADPFRVTQSMGDIVECSGGVRRLAVELGKIASDLRLLSSGPHAGLRELILPAVQPGSSIMPGKINPSVPEMVNQVCYQVFGCDHTVAIAAEAGQLELNVMMPVIAWNALFATDIVAAACDTLRIKTVEGMYVDERRTKALLDGSTATAAALNPHLGYARVAEFVRTAVATGRTIREVVLESGLLDAERLDALLAPAALTSPGVRP